MTAALMEKPGASKVEAEQQVVVLHLGADIYGVDIGSIHTVLIPQPITPVPNVAPYILGVMNLRGRVVPVLDLRARFGMPPLDAGLRRSARIVIVEANGSAAAGAAGGLAAGLVVDSVSEVLWLSADDIEPPSALLGAAEGRSLTGIGRIPGGRRKGDDPADDAERLLLLLDIPQVLALIVAPDGPAAA